LIIQHYIHGTCELMQHKMHGRLLDSKKLRTMKILSHVNQLIQVASHVNTHRHCWSKLGIFISHQRHQLTCQTLLTLFINMKMFNLILIILC
jgi:hypothetical protein